MFSFLLEVAIAVVVLWGIFTLLPILALPAVFVTIITVLVVVGVVVYLIRRIPQ
jgi:hypothetical protein